MLRSVIIASVMVLGLALPATAQEKANQEAGLAGEAIVKAFNKALLAHDAPALAALYTEDAVVFTPDGPLSGRAAIEKMHAQELKQCSPDPSKLLQVTAIGDNVRLRGGSWSGTCQGGNGPVHLRGYWTTTDVRDGTNWKIRMETDNVASPDTR